MSISTVDIKTNNKVNNKRIRSLHGEIKGSYFFILHWYGTRPLQARLALGRFY